MVKIATVCSGIGSPEQALKNLEVKHKVVFACEIDKYARQTYEANHKAKIMYTDMTKKSWANKNQYADLFIGGIPCQAFSLAGKRLGELDPRGLLFFDFYRYVKNQQPKVFIIENVKGLLSDAGGKTFQNWLLLLGNSVNGNTQMFNHPDSLEYNLHHTVLNSKNFGVPQNRERVFIVGIRKDLPNDFRFPKGWKLDKRLKDILEPVVDEKYYLSEKMINYLHNTNDKHKFLGNGFKFEPRNKNGIASCVTARCFKQGCDDNYISEPYCAAMRGRNPENLSDRTTGANLKQTLEPNSQGITNTITSVQKDNLIVEPIRVNEATKKGYDEAFEGDSINLSNPNGETRRGRVGKQIANTLDTACNQAVVSTQRIRRLTPLECFRLQGFPDTFIKPCSDSQTYKQAGNSITVFVMQAIIKNLLNILTSK